LVKWEVRDGGVSIPQGPLILVANHVSWIDPPLLIVTFPREIAFMAKEELFSFWLWRIALGWLGAFPVHRERVDRTALRRSVDVLKMGMVLGMFPEGSRSPGKELQSGLPGAAYIAMRSGATILPVGVVGTEQIKGMPRLFHRPKLVINIGQPFHLPPVDGRLTGEKLTLLADLIMGRVAELLPESYRGVYLVRGQEDGN
jgi:1-acyl-sn-glycerol-3-phosphate acyltransferase